MRQKPEIRKCIVCGKEFKFYNANRPKELGHKGLYCSMDCYHKDRWGSTGKCIQCGKPAKIKFCSDRCRKDYWNEHGYQKHKLKWTWQYKIDLMIELGGKCSECGCNDIRVLDIHHIDPSKKIIPPNKQWTWSRRIKDWKANKGNLKLLCSNCHRIHTWIERGFGDVLDYHNLS